jgi:hypothetical protein
MSALTAGKLEATDSPTEVDFPELEGLAVLPTSPGVFGDEPLEVTRVKSPVLVASLATFDGDDPADVRLKEVQSDGANLFVEEEASVDDELRHTDETIQFAVAWSGPIQDASGSVIGEAGVTKTVQADRGEWHTISLDETYDNPVVFAQIMSHEGADPCHVRVRNVKSSSFEYQIEEWGYLDGAHVEEEIGYMVFEKGRHNLDDGTLLEVQTVSADHTWSDVGFEMNFGREPAVVTRSQTQNGPDEIVTRQRNLTSEGVDVRVQEEEASNGDHVNETIGVLATTRKDAKLTLGRAEGVTDEWHIVDFDPRLSGSPVALTSIETFNGSNPAASRIRGLTPAGVEVHIEEETSSTSETTHTEETVSVVGVPEGPLWDDSGNKIGEAGRFEAGQPDADHWHGLNFRDSYSDPVVFMEIMTHNGKDPCHIRIRNVESDGCEFQIEEWNYLNGPHMEETIGFFVAEKGVHTLSDGTELHVGRTQSDHTWSGQVGFIPDFKNKQPTLITRCQTQNGSDAVVTRSINLDAHGFKARLQEEEGSNGPHVAEDIGFIGAARPSKSVPALEATGFTSKVSGFLPSTCGFQFVNGEVSGGYPLPQPIELPDPVPDIKEVGDASNGMCGGMVYAAFDYYHHNISPWSDEHMEDPPPNSPTSPDVPDEDSELFKYISERLFDSFTGGSGNKLGAVLYQTLMNSANTKKWGQVKKSRNEVMKEQWEDTIKPSLDRGDLCPLGLIQVDTHGNPLKTGLNKIGDNHQVLAYGYKKSGRTIEIYVYDPNSVNDNDRRIQFTKKSDLSNWFEPKNVGSNDPLYAFFAPAYSPKQPPQF